MRLKPGLKKAGGNWDRKRLDNLHTPNPGYPKEHWVECQRCGFDFRESGTHKEWTGAIVCGGCFDYRQPQDFVRGRIDDIAAKGLVRPPPPQTFGTDGDTTETNSSPVGDGVTDNPADEGSAYTTFNLNTL